jgi:hypothetical protein
VQGQRGNLARGQNAGGVGIHHRIGRHIFTLVMPA